MPIDTILTVAALILFVLATLGIGGRFNLTAAGLACMVATLLV